MGCDIHAHLEVQIDNTWHYYIPIEFNRSYKLFSKMAGIRSWEESPKPIAKPRGLPNDISFMTQRHNTDFGIDGHSHSWLNYAELLELLKFIDTELGYKPWGAHCEGDNLKWADFGVWLFGNRISSLKKYPSGYPDDLQDVRLVFWFDN